MQFLIITGMSGAGKSHTMAILEDLGFYCVDNMPLELIMHFAEICLAAKDRYAKVALVADVRVGEKFSMLKTSLDEIVKLGCEYKILFLDAATDVLVTRYKETRRKHPLSSNDTVSYTEAIEKERLILEEVRNNADFVIDTSRLHSSKLRETIITLISSEKKKTITINVVSFGFKFGSLAEADLLFDVRFLPNPYYTPELRTHTGMDADVQEYVFANGKADEFWDKLSSMIEYLLPQYVDEGKASLTIGIGCTGGKHRSVTIAEKLSAFIKEQNYICTVNHRDIKRG